MQPPLPVILASLGKLELEPLGPGPLGRALEQLAEEGAAQARSAAQMMEFYLAQAATADASQRRMKPGHVPRWIAGR